MATNHETRDGQRTIYRSSASESMSQAVVTAVADAADVDPVATCGSGDAALEPLYSAIDPDALNDVFRSDDDAPQTASVVQFRYEGFEVTARSDGTVVVSRSERDRAS